MSLRARPVWVSLAAVISVALTASLGIWQLDRAAQKQRWADVQAARAQWAPWTNQDWPCSAGSLADWPEQRGARLTGRWVAGKTVYLDNRVMNERTGFYVATPLMLDPAPPCGPAMVLVQRGWVPRNAQDRTRLMAVPDEAGLVHITGRIAAALSEAYQLGHEATPTPATASPLIRQNMRSPDWSAWLQGRTPQGLAPQGGTPQDPVPHPAKLAPGALYQVDSPGHAGEGLGRQWPRPETGVGKHQAYAAQWFAFSFIISGLYVWFQIIRPRHAR